DFVAASLSQLPTPRANHAAVLLADDTVLTAGGVTAYGALGPDYAQATAAITLIDTGQGYVADASGKLVLARADSCAAVLEDGSVLVAGGAWKDGNGLHAARETDLIVPQGRDTTARNLAGPTQGNDWSLQQGRYRAACVRLRDGSVLVTGGLQAPPAGGAPLVLQSAEIYTPVGAPAQ